MYFTHNEVKSVFAQRSNHSKFYLEYLYKLIYEYISTYHLSISKRVIDPDYSALNEKIGTNPKAPKFRLSDRDRIIKRKKPFSKGYTNNWWREIFVIYFVLKTNPWTYKTKDLNRKPIIWSFYEKEMLLSKL